MTSERRWLLALVVATGVLGTVYLVTMPPGLPYDEPSHWLNVQFYLEHHRLPVLDDPGVTYEAQMGPVAYALMALAAAPWWPSSPESAFYAARAMGLLELMVLVVLVWRLTRKALPGRPQAALLAAAVLALNPMLLAMSTSVQNDVLALVLAAAAIDVATSGASGARRSVVVGALVGLGILTKITVWPAGLVLGVWMVWRRRFAEALVYGLVVLLVSGWWFVRNILLYGDLTGAGGVDAAGYDFPPRGWQPVDIARDVATYLWIPVEYVRNTIEAPLAVELGVVLLTILGVVVVLLSWRDLQPTGRLLGVVAIVAVVGWVVVVVAVQAVAFRFAYVALPAWVVAFGWLATRRGGRAVGLLVVVSLVALDLWFLLELQALIDPGLLDPSVRVAVLQ
jgi:Dolichyl-phosphate-mannose-protein mannosyltransferase